MDRQILKDCKDFIETDQLDELQSYIYEWFKIKDTLTDYCLPIEYLYQQIYLHSCLKKKKHIAEWLKSLFTILFDDVQQIGLRQMFSYGNYLLNK